jgi:histidinol-phosphate aminotransferase
MPPTFSLSIARSDLLTDLNRRQWLSIGAAAAFPLATVSKPGHNSIRLSLNENPFGPSPLALQAVKAQLAGLSSYAGDEVAELTKTIAAREDGAIYRFRPRTLQTRARHR